MKISGNLRMIFGVLAGLAMISVAVIAMQGSAQTTATVTMTQHEACTGDCATCPHAQSQPCPPEAHEGAAGEAQSASATVDTDRCIGCVRCVNVSPEAFRMNPDTRKAEVVEGAEAEDIARGAQACPVDAIVVQ